MDIATVRQNLIDWADVERVDLDGCVKVRDAAQRIRSAHAAGDCRALDDCLLGLDAACLTYAEEPLTTWEVSITTGAFWSIYHVAAHTPGDAVALVLTCDHVRHAWAEEQRTTAEALASGVIDEDRSSRPRAYRVRPELDRAAGSDVRWVDSGAEG